MVKECKRCENILPFSMFGKNSNTKDGRENTCKSCRIKRKPKKVYTCKCCGIEYISNSNKTKYCSLSCNGKRKKRRAFVTCSFCGSDKEINKYKEVIVTNHFCDQICRTEFLKEDMKGKNNPNYSKINYKCDGCNLEIKIKPHRAKVQKHIFCSNDCYKENIGGFYLGENNNFYNHDLTMEERLSTRRYKDYYVWRDSVYERDKFACQRCGDDKGGNLEAHHILNYSEHKDVRTELNNGITFCFDCHKEFHMKFGYRNNDGEQLNLFLERMLMP